MLLDDKDAVSFTLASVRGTGIATTGCTGSFTACTIGVSRGGGASGSTGPSEWYLAWTDWLAVQRLGLRGGAFGSLGVPATARPTTTTVVAAVEAESNHRIMAELPDIPAIAGRAQGALGSGRAARDEARRQGTPIGGGSHPDGRTRITLGCGF